MSTLYKQHPNIFLNNKYLKWYEQIMAAGTTIGSCEKHHIIPKSILKNNNLVSLSLRQHYIAHLLLVRCVQPIYRKKMLYAVTAMKFKVINRITINSRIFARIKAEANIHRSIALRGRTHTPEAKAKIKAKRALQGCSDETKARMSAAHLGKKTSPSAIEKTRQFHLGRTRSDETKQRLCDERATRKPIHCEYCGGEFLPGNFHRWHGLKCKHRISDDAVE